MATSSTLDITAGGRRAAEDEAEPNAAPKRQRKPKPYVPVLRSGPYALILALSSVSEDALQGLTKAQTIERAQPHCDASFTAPSDPTKFYTAWNSMKTLLEKDLVYERGRPLRKYALTEDGWEVAHRIRKTAETGQRNIDAFVGQNPAHLAVTSAPDISTATESAGSKDTAAAASRPEHRRSKSRIDEDGFIELFSSSPLPERPASAPVAIHNNPRTAPSGPAEPQARPQLGPPSGQPTQPQLQSEQTTLPDFQPVIIPASSFSIHLVLDNREVRAKTDRDYIQQELVKKDVVPIMRSLELGDALWVAKCHDPNLLRSLGEEGDEIVLDYIVERKRLDDLVGSIKDGRFQEQKFRLRKSGVQNVIYIIEEITLSQDVASRYHEAVDSAIASTQVVNGFFVKRTPKLDDTIRYLARMTATLKRMYESRPLALIPASVLSPTTYLPLLDHLRSTASSSSGAGLSTLTAPSPNSSRNSSSSSSSYYITYPAFSSLASKSESLTLRDVFLKMLMCTRGVSGDKALEIQKTWKTPAAFFAVLDASSTVDANNNNNNNSNSNSNDDTKKRDELLFARMGNLVGRKKVGKALSKKVAEVWAG